MSDKQYRQRSHRSARRAGSFAEVAVCRSLRDLPVYRDRVANGAGHLWHNVVSGGNKDEGDIHGPHTAIEVKNVRSPQLESKLIDNAVISCGNSGLRYWMLVSKAVGRGVRSIDRWHAYTTAGHLFDPAGWAVRTADMSGQELLEALPELCAQELSLVGEFSVPAYGESFPPNPWAARLIFGKFRARRMERRGALLAEHRSRAAQAGSLEVPFVISPRSRPGADGKSVLCPPSEWPAYAEFSDFRNALEAVGAIPQMPTVRTVEVPPMSPEAVPVGHGLGAGPEPEIAQLSAVS